MKIRDPRLVRAAGWLGTKFALGLISTLRFELHNIGPVMAPVEEIPDGPRYLYCLWHENLLLPASKLGHPDLAVLISKHADGQILGSLILARGMGMVQGSTNRGGVEAVKAIINGTAGRRHLVVTPDGPRGPRREVQGGAIYIASRTGMQLVPVGIGYQSPFRMKSWDRFAVPRPGSRAVLINGEPMTIPAGLRSEGLERYRVIVQAEMERLNAIAEAWAKTGRVNPADIAPKTKELA
ncbi:MAG: lysophospholipid acyltransferase family protein [Fimbriiglobus sp.]